MRELSLLRCGEADTLQFECDIMDRPAFDSRRQWPLRFLGCSLNTKGAKARGSELLRTSRIPGRIDDVGVQNQHFPMIHKIQTFFYRQLVERVFF